MRTLVATVAFAIVLALSGVSEAAQISSPVIFGAIAQEGARCTVLNGGTTALAVTLKLLNEYGGTEATYNCGSMAPGSFCAVRRTIDNAGAYACTATAGTTSNLRGSLVLEEKVFDSVWQVYFFRALRSAPLR